MSTPESALAPPVPGVSHRGIDLGDVMIHCAEAGAANGGVPIVLLHGFPELWYAWRHQLVALGRDRHVVAIDLPGYGLSSKPRDVESYGIARIVEALRRLCQHLGAPRIVLVGHDWGGAIAWAFAALHPGLVQRLVIINAPHPATFARELRRSPRQMAASAYVLLFRTRLAEMVLRARDHALLDRLVKRGLRKGYFTAEDAVVYRAGWRVHGALTGGLNYYRALRYKPRLPRRPLDVPTLVIWGERDRFLLTGMLRGLERYVRRLRVERVPDASHWIVHERPELVSTLIASFVDQGGCRAS